MATYLTIRRSPLAGIDGRFGGGVAGSFVLHAAFAALILSWAYLSHAGQNWGQSNATAGAIQATMVTAIPLPPKAPADENNVLATDMPSPAPITAPHTVEVPAPDAIPVPVKPTKTAKTTVKNTPVPPLHPQPTKPELNKAPAGDAPGLRIAMSSTETRAGTFSVGETDVTFGTKFGYYNEQIKRNLEANWFTGLLDPQAAGHRVYITFTIARDGTPSNIRIAQPSGDASLDQTALSAVRHIDTFPPLPDAYTGSYLNVLYSFDPPPRQ